MLINMLLLTQVHMGTEHGTVQGTAAGPKYTCNICGKVLSDSHNLQRHIARHSDVRKFACPRCPRRFKVRRVNDVVMWLGAMVHNHVLRICLKAAVLWSFQCFGLLPNCRSALTCGSTRSSTTTSGLTSATIVTRRSSRKATCSSTSW